MKVNTGMDLPHISPGSLINGKELALQLGFPQKSLNGLPVIETAEFGRNIVTYDQTEGSRAALKLGNVFHMGKPENTSVEIDVNSLTMHTFVTGSTGSGKSNTIYQMLNELVRKNIHFLVIEPTKGEYKKSSAAVRTFLCLAPMRILPSCSGSILSAFRLRCMCWSILTELLKSSMLAGRCTRQCRRC